MSYYGLDALLVSSRARAAHAYRKRRHHLSGSYGARESAMWACSRPPWARATSSHRSQRTCIHPTGPCAVHGAAGPVVGGIKVPSGTAENPGYLEEDQPGKGVVQA